MANPEETATIKRMAAAATIEERPHTSRQAHLSQVMEPRHMSGLRLPPEHESIIKRMAAAGYSDSEIGQHIGQNRQYVGRRRRELGIRPGHSPTMGAMVARLHIRRKWTAGMKAARCI